MNIRQLLCAVCLLSGPVFTVRAQIHAQFFFSDFTQNPQGVKQMTMEPLLEYTVFGTNIVTGDRIRRTTSASGSTTVSNIAPGTYRVILLGSFTTTTFTNSFGTNVSGLVNAKDYISISTNLPSGLFAYSQSAADSLFIEDPATKSVDEVLTWDGTNWVAAASAGGGSATNVNFGDGTNTVHRVDAGGTNHFDVPPETFDDFGASQAATNGITAGQVTNTLGATPVVSALSATTATTSGTSTNSQTLGGFTAAEFARTTNVFVSATGNDFAAGSFAAPLLTITNAFQRLANNGTIILRGGDYFNYDNNFTNAEGITVMAYPGEQPKFWWGEGIAPGSFSALSNGIFTMTVTAGISNTIHFLTNLWDGWHPAGRGIMLIQTNTPFELAQQSPLLPAMFNGSEDTNHVEHTPLLRAASVASMTHSNRLWRLEGSTLYVKFAVSNVAGGLWLPATNRTASFIHSATPRTRVKIVGVTSMFGWHGFDFAGAGSASAESCRVVGAGANGFTVGLTSDAPLTGDVSVRHCEAALVNGFGFNYTGSRDGRRWSRVTEDNCKWVLCLREGSSVREGVSRTVNNSIVWGGWITQYGWVDQGSSTWFFNCKTVSNSVAGFQLGAAGASLGRRSFQSLTDCKMIQDNVSIQLDDENNVLEIYNNFFDPFTSLGGVNVSANPTTHQVRRSGNVMASGAFNLINGTGVSSNPSLYPAGLFAIGADSRFQAGSLIMGGSDNTAGFAFYLNNAVKFTTTGIAFFAAGQITNGNMVLLGRTNTAPPTDPNHSYVATSTNAPGTLFLWDGSEWDEVREGGAAQTPWTSNIDADGFDLSGVSNLAGSGAITGFTNLLELADFAESGKTNLIGVGPNTNALAIDLATMSTTGHSHNITNVTINPAVLSPASAATNYIVTLLPGASGNMITVFLANTNAHVTFAGFTNATASQRSVLFNGWTNTPVSLITFASPVRTNSNLNVWVTNGTAKVINFYAADTSGTNILVSDTGRYQ